MRRQKYKINGKRKRKNEEASARFFGNLKIMVERKQYEWKDRIAEAVNE